MSAPGAGTTVSANLVPDLRFSSGGRPPWRALSVRGAALASTCDPAAALAAAGLEEVQPAVAVGDPRETRGADGQTVLEQTWKVRGRVRFSKPRGAADGYVRVTLLNLPPSGGRDDLADPGGGEVGLDPNGAFEFEMTEVAGRACSTILLSVVLYACEPWMDFTFPPIRLDLPDPSPGWLAGRGDLSEAGACLRPGSPAACAASTRPGQAHLGIARWVRDRVLVGPEGKLESLGSEWRVPVDRARSDLGAAESRMLVIPVQESSDPARHGWPSLPLTVEDLAPERSVLPSFALSTPPGDRPAHLRLGTVTRECPAWRLWDRPSPLVYGPTPARPASLPLGAVLAPRGDPGERGRDAHRIRHLGSWTATSEEEATVTPSGGEPVRGRWWRFSGNLELLSRGARRAEVGSSSPVPAAQVYLHLLAAMPGEDRYREQAFEIVDAEGSGPLAFRVALPETLRSVHLLAEVNVYAALGGHYLFPPVEVPLGSGGAPQAQGPSGGSPEPGSLEVGPARWTGHELSLESRGRVTRRETRWKVAARGTAPARPDGAPEDFLQRQWWLVEPSPDPLARGWRAHGWVTEAPGSSEELEVGTPRPALLDGERLLLVRASWGTHSENRWVPRAPIPLSFEAPPAAPTSW